MVGFVQHDYVHGVISLGVIVNLVLLSIVAYFLVIDPLS